MSRLYIPIVGNGPTEPQGANSSEFAEQLLQLMANDPGQRRQQGRWNINLTDAAQLHCESMARRGYFAHVTPDGVWPNKMARDAGYVLPASWPDDANYVESIAAGYPTPQEAWSAWMHSPSHKRHLLGESSFFAAQTCVGVGYYHLSGSHFEHYWSVFSAPVSEAA